MNTTEASGHNASGHTKPNRSLLVGAVALAVVGALVGAFAMRRYDRSNLQATATPETTSFRPTPDHDAGPSPSSADAEANDTVELPKDRWEVSGIKIAPAQVSPFSTTVHLTGKVSLNQDRVAHIFPMVEGTVESVSVSLGEKVKAGQLLATIHSREIGESKLKLFQAQLLYEMAKTKHGLQTEVARNVEDLIKSLREQMPIEKIESAFRSRPMAEYRERLLAAYSNYTKSQADVSRLQNITNSGAVSGKTLLSAEATRNADLATFQSRLEEVEHGLRVATLLSSQSLKEAETQVAVARTSLHILGVSEEELKNIDPAEQGEAISHYQLRAPFDGTVLTKDVVLSEQVRPDVMLLSIADLSAVWVLADMYQEHIPLLQSLSNQTVQLHSDSWPDRTFEAQVFFAGETMDELTRTISMRAIADNAEHLLKPGMFVTVNLSDIAQQDALQVPLTAIQEHEGQKFVFVQLGEDKFARRNVTVGTANGASVVIKAGLEADEPVVVSGGFILKSLMLADLMGEE